MPIPASSGSAPPARTHRPAQGIACICAAMALLTVSDSLGKLMTETLPVGQIIFWRSFFSFLGVLLLVRYRYGFGTLRVQDWRSHVLRGLCVIGTTYSFLWAVALLPLADALAIVMSAPLFAFALAPLILKERVGLRLWLSLLVGFAGVLVIIRPAGPGLEVAVLLPLATAVFGALRDVVTRYMSTTESSASIMFYAALAMMLGGLFSLPLGWQAPALWQWALLAGAGVVQFFGHFLAIEAYRLTQAAVVSPFKYTTLLWAALWGYGIWGDVPGWHVWGGAAIIVASTLFIYRSSRRGAL